MATSSDVQKRLYEKFYSDPDWPVFVEQFTKHLEPLMDMTTVDTTQPAEHVKAEVIARSLAYNTLADMINATEISTRKIERKVNQFR
jgi:hypothetical protein